MRRIALISLLVLAALAVFAIVRYPGKAPAAGGCNADLWTHVYRPKRLRILTPCTIIEGRVHDVGREADGDLHLGVIPDDASVLNLANVMHGGGRLVVEAVCDHASTLPDVTAACAGYTSAIAAPAVGDRIRATGVYVKDRENGWNEIHPLSRIETLR
ncbi:MAG: hypothetical protein ABR567_10155 [Myxococcales bacterium]|nr:hypothetical protein [Myxococcales bacterium]